MTTPAFTIERERLKKALSVVLPTIKGGGGSEMLSMVLITCSDKVIGFTTTRIETTTQHLLVEGVQIFRDCTLALPAASLSELVSKMTGNLVTFTPINEDDWWELSWLIPDSKKPATFQIAGLDPYQYPAVELSRFKPLLLFDAEQFKGYVRQAHTMLSKSGTYASLESMCLELDEAGEFITLYGADSTHGIARIYVPIAERLDAYMENSFLIPAKSVNTLMNHTPDVAQGTMLWDGNNQVGFRFGPTTIVTSLMSDTYPKVQSLFRDTSAYHVVVKRESLQRAMAMAQTLYGNETKAIVLEMQADCLNIRSYKTERGGALDQDIPTEDVTPGGFIQVNPGYLSDSLGVLNTDYVTLEIESQAHSLAVTSSEMPNCLHLIFPMHGSVPGKGVAK